MTTKPPPPECISHHWCGSLIFSLWLCCFLLGSLQTQAQLVADGKTTVLDGIATNLTGDLVIGTNGSFTTLMITNGASLNHFGPRAVIGTNATARSNSVIVVGPGSTWNYSSNLIIGNLGSFNHMSILEGATATNGLYLLGGELGSVGNTLIISGTNSICVSTNPSTGFLAPFSVGFRGSGHGMIISNGAVGVGLCQIGGFADFFSNNFVKITGTGSTFIGNIIAGSFATFSKSNDLVVEQGGRIFGGVSLYANDSLISITDPNSLVACSNALVVGSYKVNARLTVSNAATLVTRDANVPSINGDSNSVTVSGEGSLWTNSSSLMIGNGTARWNVITVQDGAKLRSSDIRVGRLIFASSNSIAVSGSESELLTKTLVIGDFNAQSNWLLATNAGRIRCDSITIGSNASGNSVHVTGPGSRLDCRFDLVIAAGDPSHFNRLLVTNGGIAVNGNSFIGSHPSANSNIVVASGTGTIWSNLGSIYFNGGKWNQLIISNGATVFAVGLSGVGTSSTSNNNVTVVGGNLIGTSNTSQINISSGTLVMSGGLLRCDRLNIPGPAQAKFTGGTMETS